MTNKKIKAENQNFAKSKKKKAVIFTITIISIIVLFVVIFCSVFFTIQFDLNKEIEDYFAVSDKVQYSYGCFSSTTYEVQSSVAKQIVLKHLKDRKFKNNNDFNLTAGIIFITFHNGDKIFGISSNFIEFTRKIGVCYNPVPRIDNLDEIAQELIAVSTKVHEEAEE